MENKNHTSPANSKQSGHPGSNTKKPPLARARGGRMFYFLCAMVAIASVGFYYYTIRTQNAFVANKILADGDVKISSSTKTEWKRTALSNQLRKTAGFDPSGQWGVIAVDKLGSLYLTSDGGKNWNRAGFIGQNETNPSIVPSLPSALYISSLGVDFNKANGTLTVTAIVLDDNASTTSNNAFLYTASTQDLGARTGQLAGQQAYPAWKWAIQPVGTQPGANAPTLKAATQVAEVAPATDADIAEFRRQAESGELFGNNSSNSSGEGDIGNEAEGNDNSGKSGGQNQTEDRDQTDDFGVLDRRGLFLPIQAGNLWQREGLSWKRTGMPKINGVDSGKIQATSFFSSPNGSVLGFTTATAGSILLNTGQQWQVKFPSDKRNVVFYSAAASSSGRILAYGAIPEAKNFGEVTDTFYRGAVYLSVNSGGAWARSTVAADIEQIYDIQWVNDDLVYMIADVGLRGCIFRSIDGGQSFVLDYTDNESIFRQLAVGNGFLVAIDLNGGVYQATAPTVSTVEQPIQRGQALSTPENGSAAGQTPGAAASPSKPGTPASSPNTIKTPR